MSVGLREQHAQATRERILSAVAELVEHGAVEALTMEDVAAASAVSLRTIYRYYSTRDELLAAAGRWIGEVVLQHPYPRDLDEVASLFEAGCADFDERPGLVGAMVHSELGRRVRGYRRRDRLAAIGHAVRAELPAMPEDEVRRAEAVLSYLHNIVAYTTLREEAGLSGEEIGAAMGWAIRTLVDDLRRTYGGEGGQPHEHE